MATTSPLGLRYPPLTGVTPNVPRDVQALAEDVQQALGSVAAGMQEGVIDAGSFEVTQASGGASLTLDIASNTGSGAYVQDDGISRGALFYVPPTGAKSTVTVTAAHATLPRVDAIVLSLAGVVSIVTGTATSGATLDNARDGSHGGAAIPSDALHLADALVPATDTTISNSQIRDRRKWARGAYCRIILSSGSLSTASGNYALIDSANVAPRIECSGAPLRFTLVIPVGNASTANNYFSIAQDGTGIESGAVVGAAVGGKYLGRWRSDSGSVDLQVATLHQVWHTVPAAGSHVFGPMWARDAGTLSAVVGTGVPLIFVVEELVMQNTRNNATTSG